MGSDVAREPVNVVAEIIFDAVYGGVDVTKLRDILTRALADERQRTVQKVLQAIDDLDLGPLGRLYCNGTQAECDLANEVLAAAKTAIRALDASSGGGNR